VQQKKKLFPQSYGMALGTHGVSHYMKARHNSDLEFTQNSPVSEATPKVRKPNYHDYMSDYMQI
jgi:hypothetical protein